MFTIAPGYTCLVGIGGVWGWGGGEGESLGSRREARGREQRGEERSEGVGEGRYSKCIQLENSRVLHRLGNKLSYKS